EVADRREGSGEICGVLRSDRSKCVSVPRRFCGGEAATHGVAPAAAVVFLSTSDGSAILPISSSVEVAGARKLTGFGDFGAEEESQPPDLQAFFPCLHVEDEATENQWRKRE
ncbi:hypothetical protein U1Q18_033818, partial [Sarracenia purpurea var. burkii]